MGGSWRTILPHLRQSNPMPPLFDGEFTTAAKIWEEKAVVIAIDAVNAFSMTC